GAGPPTRRAARAPVVRDGFSAPGRSTPPHWLSRQSANKGGALFPRRASAVRARRRSDAADRLQRPHADWRLRPTAAAGARPAPPPTKRRWEESVLTSDGCGRL